MGFLSIVDPDRIDTNEKLLQQGQVTVGTSAVELKIGATRDQKRQVIIIYNNSNVTIYIGGSDVTTSGSTMGIPVLKTQVVTLPIGDQPIYAIAGSAGNVIIVMELG